MPRAGWWATALLVVAGAGYVAYQWQFSAGLDVTSEPSGAEVRVDARRLGLTPLRVTLAPGLHRLEVRHSHYADDDRRIDLPAGETTRVRVTLERGVGRIELFSNPRGAWVDVDGERRDGRTPLLLELPSGEHELAMGMDERRSAEATVLVVAGEQQTVRLDLNIDPHGSLVVDTVPAGATVTLPGSDTAYRSGVRLPIGEYRVQVRHPGYQTRDVRFDVRYGDNRYRVELPRAYGVLTVVTAPQDVRVQVRYRDSADAPLRRLDYRTGGMRVPVGAVEVRAAAIGRRSETRRLDLSEAGATVRFDLAPMTARSGSTLRDPLPDGGQGPELVVVPPGTFAMGSRDGPPSERPLRQVTITEPFAIGVHEVTVAEYRHFAAAAGRRLDERIGAAAADLPVTHVSFADARAYADWLSAQTGQRYRLPSEAEWEYAARAGSRGEYTFGDDPKALCGHGNIGDVSLRRRYQAYDSADCDDGFVELAPVGSFAANAFGLHDVHGNAAEWVQECGLPSYADAPQDGASIDDGANCRTHGVRGGSWDDAAANTRLAKRNIASSASGNRGFRVLREL
ncbi:MAG: SUMF1/EgtB/PvdO family nonheme iron enzyme [Pseudomonadales bacterium]